MQSMQELSVHSNKACVKMQLVQAVLLSLCGFVTAQAMNNSCNRVIGKMPTTFNSPAENPSMLSGLYLNMNYSFNCIGDVIAWRMCYYFNSRAQNSTQVKAGIWRPRENDEFELVNDSVIELSIPNLVDGTQFLCRRWDLNSTIKVREGDIVGLYVKDTSSIHMFEANNLHDGIMRVENTTDIYSNVSKSSLESARFSLYLEAVTDGNATYLHCNGSNDVPPKTIMTTQQGTVQGMTTAPTTMTTSQGEPNPVIIVICLVAGLILLLVIILVIVVPCYRLRKTKDSGPVLITKLKKGKNIVNNKILVADSTRVNRSTETEVNNLSNSDCRLLQPTHTQHQPLLSPPDFGDLMRHKHQHPSDMLARRKALLCKLDLRRSYSAAEALNLMQSSGTADNEAQFTSSTEYPYVLHASEVVGNDRPVFGSLPNILQFAQRSKSPNSLVTDSHYGHPVENRDNPDTIPYSSIEADESNSIYDEPYAAGGHVVWNFGDSSTLTGKRRSTDLNFQDYRYEEYPLNWTPAAAQHALNVGRQTSGAYDLLSPEYQEINEYQECRGSSALLSNQASSLKQYIDIQNSVPSQKPKMAKPPIQPRKKLAHTHVASKQIIQPSGHVVGDHHHADVTITNDSTEMSPEVPHDHACKLKYMKLLQSTTDDVHGYSRLLHNN